VKFPRSRPLAGAAIVALAVAVAVAGVATGGVMARADGGAPRARASASGIALTPATVEHVARRGTVGRVRIKNTTHGTLRVTVAVRPWRQNRVTGRVAVNGRTSLSPYVVASPRRFNLRRGSRTVRLRMRRTPPGGSLYGGVDVFAKQRKRKARNGIIPQYRVVGRIRLNPARPRPNLKLGSVRVFGRGNGRSLALEVRNLGNTIDSVGGTVAISGPSSRTSALTAVPVVPGQVVALRAGSLRGLPRGGYSARFRVTQGSRRYTVTRGFRL